MIKRCLSRRCLYDWTGLGPPRSEAQAYLKRGLAAAGQDPYVLLSAAEVQAMLGQASQAVEPLKKALERGYPDPFFPVIIPDFLPIRKNPDFRALFQLGN